MSTSHISGLTSFESCHSNIFSIVDLQGIKWRKYYDSSTLPTYPIDDHILKLYASCIESGVLACWRRVSHEKEKNNNESSSKDKKDAPNKQLVSGVQRSKELWLFWWKNEEINNGIIQDVVEPFKDSLKSDVSGSWDEDGSVFEYDLRTLVFKAIHNHLEHRLTSQAGYLRLGRWFIKPYDRVQSRKVFGDDGYGTDGYASPTSAPASPMKGKSQTSKSTKNINDSINAMKSEWQDKVSIAFSFFLHGDSQVMCAVETAQHDQLVAVSDDLITILSQGGGGGGYIEKLKSQNVTFPIQVVLAPYGLRGALTGESWGPYHEISKILIDEWSMFYNVQFGNSNYTSSGASPLNDLPAIMEVIVGGVRMKYPTKLILIEKTLDDILFKFNQDQLSQPVSNQATNTWRRSVKSVITTFDGGMTAQQQHTQHKPLDIHRSNDVPTRCPFNDIVQNAWKSSTKQVNEQMVECNTNVPFKTFISQLKPYGRLRNENRHERGSYARFDYIRRNSNAFHQRSVKMRKNSGKNASRAGQNGMFQPRFNQNLIGQNGFQAQNGFQHEQMGQHGGFNQHEMSQNNMNQNIDQNTQELSTSQNNFENGQNVFQLDQNGFQPSSSFQNDLNNQNNFDNSHENNHENKHENNNGNTEFPNKREFNSNDQTSQSDKNNNLEHFPENFHSLIRVRRKSGKYHSAIIEESDKLSELPDGQLSTDPLEPKKEETAQSDNNFSYPRDLTSVAFFSSLSETSGYDTISGTNTGYNTANNTMSGFNTTTESAFNTSLPNSTLLQHSSSNLSSYSSRNPTDLTTLQTLLPHKRARLNDRLKVEVSQDTCEMFIKNQVHTAEFTETIDSEVFEPENVENSESKKPTISTISSTTTKVLFQTTVSVAVKRKPEPDNYAILTPSPDDKNVKIKQEFNNTSNPNSAQPNSFPSISPSENSPENHSNTLMNGKPEYHQDSVISNDLIEDELKHGHLNYAFPTPPSNEPLSGVNDEMLAEDEFLARNNRSDPAEVYAEQYSTVFMTPVQQIHHESGNYGKVDLSENEKIDRKFNYVPNVTYAKLKAIKYRSQNGYRNWNDGGDGQNGQNFQNGQNDPNHWNPEHQNDENRLDTGQNGSNSPSVNISTPKTPLANSILNQVYSPRPYSNQVRTPKSIGSGPHSQGPASQGPQSQGPLSQGPLSQGPLSQGPASVGMPKTPGSVRMPGSVTMPGSVPKFPNVRSVRNPNSVNPKTPKSVGIGSVLTPGKCGLKTPGNPQSIDPSSYPFIDSTATGSHPNRIQNLQRLPEAHSLTFNLFLSDSLLNVFRDRCFDQCPVCVCNFDLRGFDHKFVDKVNHAKDLGLNSSSEYPCTCAFSSIRNRSISFATGLLLEDELEVLTSNDQEHQNKIVKLRRRIENAKNGSILSGLENLTDTDKKTCLVLIGELIKHESCPVFGPTFTWLVGSLKDSRKNSKFLDIERRSKRSKSQKMKLNSDKNDVNILESSPKSPTDPEKSKLRRNFIAEYDTYLACLQAIVAGRAVIDGTIVNTIATQAAKSKQWDYISTTIHPWVYSCSVLPINEPIVNESVTLSTKPNENNALVPIPTTGPEQHIVSLLKTLLPVLQNSVQKRSKNRTWMHMIRVRGPLTWFEFVDLGGQCMDRSLAQPLAVPRFITSNETMGVKNSGMSNNLVSSGKNGLGYEVGPNGLEQWQRLGLEPNSKKQDIVYTAICPDNMQNQVRGFFKELSSSYESSKLGRHRPLLKTTIKPGVTEEMNLRVNETSTENISIKLVDPNCKNPGFNGFNNSFNSDQSITQAYSEKLRELCKMLSSFTADCSLLSGGMYNWNGKLSKTIPTDPHTILKLKNIPPPVIMFYIIEPGAMGTGKSSSFSTLKLIQNWLNIIDEILSKNPCLKNLCQIQLLPALSLPQLNLTKDKFLQSIAFGSFAKAKRASIETKRRYLEISSKSGPQGFTGRLGDRNDAKKRLDGLLFADQQEFGSKCYLPAFMVADNWFDPRDLLRVGKDGDKEELRMKVQYVVRNSLLVNNLA